MARGDRAPHGERRGALLALLAALLFGAATPASKPLLAALTPLQLAGLLYLGAALGVAPLLLRERGREARASAGAASRRRLAGAVLFGGVFGPVLLLLALERAGAASISLLLNLELAATAVLGVTLFRDALGPRGWLGVAVAMTGGALLAAEGGWPGAAAAALAAAACLCWGFDNQLTSLIDGLSPARVTAAKGVVAGVTNLTLGLALAPLAATLPTLAAALAVGALCYGVSIALWVSAAQELGATRAQALFACAPFLGAALAVALLGERFGPLHFAASALMALAAALLLAARHEHAHRHEAVAHAHSHRHDDGHHLHEHPGLPASTRHSHRHRHEAVEHAHPHAPDLHHRHEH